MPSLQKCSCWIGLSHETVKPHTAKATQSKNFHDDQSYDCHSFQNLNLIFVTPSRSFPSLYCAPVHDGSHHTCSYVRYINCYKYPVLPSLSSSEQFLKNMFADASCVTMYIHEASQVGIGFRDACLYELMIHGLPTAHVFPGKPCYIYLSASLEMGQYQVR